MKELTTGMLSFVQYGAGPTVWLAFHGIGQDATAFAPFGDRLAETHTIYSIDLPYHGQNRHANWPQNITKTYWQRLLTDFLTTNQINQFSVAGFSMGGRFALLTADLFTNRLNELILLAPDGVTEDPWFRLFTNTAPGRAALRFFLRNTPLLRRAGQGLVRLGLLNPALFRFGEATLKTPEQRTQLYAAWQGFRSLTIDVPALADRLLTTHVATYLILGQYDAVLPAAHTKPLLHALPGCQLITLPTSHNSLIRRAADQWPIVAANG